MEPAAFSGKARFSFSQGCTLETLVAQIQPLTDKHFFYVVDGRELRWYESLSAVPKRNYILEMDNTTNNRRKIYISDVESRTRICCFTEELKRAFLGESSIVLDLASEIRPASPVSRKVPLSPSLASLIPERESTPVDELEEKEPEIPELVQLKPKRRL